MKKGVLTYVRDYRLFGLLACSCSFCFPAVWHQRAPRKELCKISVISFTTVPTVAHDSVEEEAFPNWMLRQIRCYRVQKQGT